MKKTNFNPPHFQICGGLFSRRDEGIIFITVLILLFLISLLALSAMDSSLLQMKMSRSYHDRQLAFEAAEAGLKQGEELLDKNKPVDCLITPQSAHWFITGSNWLSKACTGHFSSIKTQFIIETLLKDQCSYDEAGKINFLANYYRITSLANSNSQQIILQSTWVKALPELCKSGMQAVKVQLARNMWREL